MYICPCKCFYAHMYNICAYIYQIIIHRAFVVLKFILYYKTFIIKDWVFFIHVFEHPTLFYLETLSHFTHNLFCIKELSSLIHFWNALNITKVNGQRHAHTPSKVPWNHTIGSHRI